MLHVKRMSVGFAAAVCVLLVSVTALAASLDDRLRTANVHIANWQMPQALAEIEAMEKEGHGDNPEVLYTRGRYAFFSGEYKQAMDYLDQALTDPPDQRARQAYEYLRNQVEATHKVTENYKEFKSPNGYFIIRVEPGKDEILIPYAFETLERAYEQFAIDFGYRPPPPVRVEIYPKAATLAAVSSLTEEEIKTSGTIALCKYNRLMFTSPKALLKGYSWRDTLSHEYAHLVITQRSNNTVPIWMHEGLAKFQERRWRSDEPGERMMLPSSENLLAEGIKDDKLITFDEMHPSMAKLPSQEATGLAFAEVYTVMEYLVSVKGEGVFADLLTLMRNSGDAEKAMEKLLGKTFKAFQRDWMGYLKTRPSKSFDDEEIFVEKLQFVEDKPGSELLDIGQKEARDLIHLGELLQARKRYKAAVVEYNKARELIGERNPVLQTRLAECLIILGRHEEAIDALALSLDYYPNFHNTHALMGEAFYKLGRLQEAEVAMVEAIGLNVFDPKPHSILAKIYADTDRPEDATMARTNARILGG